MRVAWIIWLICIGVCSVFGCLMLLQFTANRFGWGSINHTLQSIQLLLLKGIWPSGYLLMLVGVLSVLGIPIAIIKLLHSR